MDTIIDTSFGIITGSIFDTIAPVRFDKSILFIG
jgi:hypothetical protein